ncbi:MAG TPA: SET domain-containing protein-lysine N-methyltransferase [Blastocatellia bacterium]|nr:SET domain-containing protein-lysine N-methyltransferase [Blastocatellia bacterium]
MKIKDQRLAVKRARTGLGLFAMKRIQANRRIIEYIGTLLIGEERENARGRYLFEIDENRVIDGSTRSNLARYINHSCEANSTEIISGNSIWIWSLRVIEAGEEITLDYGKEYLEQFIKPGNCKCEKCASQSRKP